MKIQVGRQIKDFHIETLPDLGSPVEVFGRLVSGPYPFLLESSLSELPEKGRFTFLGSRPFLTLTAKGNRVSISEGGRVQTLRADPFEAVKDILFSLQAERLAPEIPFPGGAVGYFSYDLRHFIERLPAAAEDDLKIPDLQLGFYDQVLAYDHREQRWLLSVASAGGKTLTDARDRLLLDLERPGKENEPEEDSGPSPGGFPYGLVSNFQHTEYLDAVRKIIHYIEEGDVYQVNLSQRFSSPLACTPFSLYRRLRERNPSYFGGYLGYPGLTIVSSSPERFLKVNGIQVETCPIKGTRKRGKNPEEDEALKQELSRSIKDRAELNMIVDLERNDLGRVCRYGSVKVREHAALETHPTVFHLVSTIEGMMREGLDVVDLLRATFPGGSITGAPKIRSMEIIDALEPHTRSVYTGSIGYISLDGRTDLNIVIRTVLIKDGTAFFHVGGGIVADSDPEMEYEETLVKGRALKEVIEA